MKLKGVQILMEILKEEGVDTIFGYPGGAVIDIYDELMNTDIRHILVRHEQAAIHAADAYARAKESVGVALVTSGPGATNTVTGIASAYMDSIPMVIFTGQVPTSLIGNDAFQEVDIVGITRPCTKHNYLVKRIEDLARIVKEAFHIARSGRPGPVLIDLPKNVQNETYEFTPYIDIELKTYNPTYTPNKKQLSRVVEMIKEAKKPVIFSGGGVRLSQASDELRTLARKAQIPVTSSLMGLGAYPGDDPLWLGMIGMHGTYRANMCTGECDLMIAVGVRFDDRVTGKISDFLPNAKIVQIDIDPTSIHKNIPVEVPIVGDCKATLSIINKMMETTDMGDLASARAPWFAQIQSWKEKNNLGYHQTDDVIKPQYVVEKLYEVTEGNAIITTEVGQNQMWAAQYYHLNKPSHFITSGGLGVMGFGLPAALGAKAACPDALVVDVAGDGSIQMNIQELATLIQYNLPVKIVILNNQFLGMVRQWQELFYDKRYASTPMEHAPDFIKLAEAYGATGLRATRPAEVEGVLKDGLSRPGTVIMEFIVDREECVYPMVPAGAAVTEMLLV
ncbi:MAG: acetolactate synthase, large subunit, biosynthetic type [Deltaproteobacteria bacterium]|nr:MAG: acetolactate synthase, large subunit, biosynthetic type [Deltaproteobacteria bacterium]